VKTAEVLFGEEVKKARSSLGLSQEDLAHKADLHSSYVSKLERGLKSPSLRVILQLAHALNTAPDELVRAVGRQLPQFKK
jgi:transcriptional regulator with XRE-family HTH domain